MSKIFDKKQMVHITAEIVVLLGVVFYFSNKNKKLMVHIEDLTQRLEEHEETVQKHDEILSQIVSTLNNGRRPAPVPVRREKIVRSPKIAEQSPDRQVAFSNENHSSTDEEEDLDEMISDELAELDEAIGADDSKSPQSV